MYNLRPQYQSLLEFIRSLYGTSNVIPLHTPHFGGREKQYLNECIDTSYVSSVGPFVDRFEAMMRELTGASFAIACVNGTAALHMSLVLAGVKKGEEVVTQPLTFVATCNTISYVGAHPVFVDVDRETLGLSSMSLEAFLKTQCERHSGLIINKVSGRRVAAVMPMHTFGHPADLNGLVRVCSEWGIPLIEDAAEAVGSYYQGRHLGTFGQIGTFSFNGNKTVTCGGGGCIVTNDKSIAMLGKHLTTTAKQAHAFEFFHDQIGYNYRMPNLNAALACAQLEQLPGFIKNKRETAQHYREFCLQNDLLFISEPPNSTSNYWLNAIVCASLEERDSFLGVSNEQGIKTRPIWTLMNRLPAFSKVQCLPIPIAEWYEQRVINLPSSVRF